MIYIGTLPGLSLATATTSAPSITNAAAILPRMTTLLPQIVPTAIAPTAKVSAFSPSVMSPKDPYQGGVNLSQTPSGSGIAPQAAGLSAAQIMPLLSVPPAMVQLVKPTTPVVTSPIQPAPSALRMPPIVANPPPALRTLPGLSTYTAADQAFDLPVSQPPPVSNQLPYSMPTVQTSIPVEALTGGPAKSPVPPTGYGGTAGIGDGATVAVSAPSWMWAGIAATAVVGVLGGIYLSKHGGTLGRRGKRAA